MLIIFSKINTTILSALPVMFTQRLCKNDCYKYGVAVAENTGLSDELYAGSGNIYKD